MTTEPTTDPHADAPDTHPVLMVYLTVRLSGRGGWSDHVRVATPDGKETIEQRSTGGGSIDQGARKAVQHLSDAIAIAMEHLEPFG